MPKDNEYSDNFFCMPENITDGKTLKTCALRPAGIYGEGELRHLPRIVVSENQMTWKLTVKKRNKGYVLNTNTY